MVCIKKERLSIIIPIAAIIILGAVITNIDRVFPTPSAAAKIGEIRDKVNFTFSETGTSPGASVTVVVFSDFFCPACNLAAPELRKAMDYYGDSINVVFKHFPAHEGSDIAAQASECARDQDKFWEYHDMLFENTPESLSLEYFESIADLLEMDVNEFSECLSTEIKDAKVLQDFRDGLANSIRGTPTFFVNNIMITGARSFGEFRQAIDAELQK